MTDELTPNDFSAFYEALHDGRTPFPWQQMLAERVMEHGWPECIDLPTASGKTACLDVAVFSLACQAARPPAERTAPRRIFYVVDRRIIVDAAHEHAHFMANRLAEAREPILRSVAERLRRLHIEPDTAPLYAARLRGGATRDDGWARTPAQAAVISGTVDQIGSRLLFRGFGPGQLTASIHAGLVANDSLLLLDEAHCAVPFLQTTRAVASYRAGALAPELPRSPFASVVLSATPPEGVAPDAVFPGPAKRNEALDHPGLHQRLRVEKTAALIACKAPTKDTGADADPLVHEAAQRAESAVKAGHSRIGVMVNRVATAREIHRRLTGTLGDREDLQFDTVLLTGRMRPYDRDTLIDRWFPILRASDPQPAERPVVLVTTQCLEVGADFSFDALVTECASLDALRQRFGRLNRLGEAATGTTAAILIRRNQTKSSDDDPIYGPALARTWAWLTERATPAENGRQDRGVVNFGYQALDALLDSDPAGKRARERELAAPTADAPVMLPAHLDALVQTAPRPAADPDVSVFLHGPDRSAPEASVVFRSDLPTRQRGNGDALHSTNDWIETLTLLPPSTLEGVSVPLWLLRRLISVPTASEQDMADVDGAQPVEDRPVHVERGKQPYSLFVLWRGRDNSFVSASAEDIRPNDTVVLSTQAMPTLADKFLDRPPGTPIDIADAVAFRMRTRPALRVHPSTLAAWTDHPLASELLDWAKDDTRDTHPGDLTERLEALAAHSGEALLPAWLRDAAQALSDNCRVVAHPEAGYVLMADRAVRAGPADQDATADADDLTSQANAELSLQQHLDDVESVARCFGDACVTPSITEALALAGWLHDLGKADPRFQTMLHGGNEFARFRSKFPLAKSAGLPGTRKARQRARELAGLPAGFRHEMLSLQLLESDSELIPAHCDTDLVKHLVASHHGYARPFAPVCRDPEPAPVDLKVTRGSRTSSLRLDQDTRRDSSDAHQLDSGVGERFWRLTRRYGWWGLAYLEALLRLADWRASETSQRVEKRSADRQTEHRT